MKETINGEIIAIPFTYNLPVIFPVIYPDEAYYPVGTLIQVHCKSIIKKQIFKNLSAAYMRIYASLAEVLTMSSGASFSSSPG